MSSIRQSNHDTYDTSGLANLRPGWSVSRTPYDVTDLYHNRGQQPQPFAVAKLDPNMKLCHWISGTLTSELCELDTSERCFQQLARSKYFESITCMAESKFGEM